uniref:KICSTOR complex protein ITFG2 n=1 Tax=Ciona intestinalis TaxID=7719 RepID=UPI000180CF97|nr:KICSTOR complex protein ITFG2 [Ciona intestinalis]|eukprot:XP_002132127.1 KICSTOR complex protein ITFG2 [Ciona intestinalis]
MRSVSFVDHLKIKVNGKVGQGCIALGDVDGDGCSELVVADDGGHVQVFKGDSTKPCWESSDFGDITCLTIADLCNEGKNCVAVFTTDGAFSILDFNKSLDAPIIHSDHVIPNIMNVLVSDLDSDQLNELIACHSDHCVSAYRWNSKHKRFTILQRWTLRQLVGNISIHVSSDEGVPSIIVSQPGCSYAVLSINWNQSEAVKTGPNISESTVTYTPLSSQSRSQNPTITCQILGDITKSSSSPAGYFALCTLDGTLKLMEEDKILWSLQVDHQLFALYKLDILGDNREEVIVCAWDGQTYIVDHDRNVVRYQFLDNVQAFCAGSFSIDSKQNRPCFVYSDFHNHVWLYYDVKLPFLKATDLLTFAESDQEMSRLFLQLGATTIEEKRSLLKKCGSTILDQVKLNSNNDKDLNSQYSKDTWL